MDPVHPPRHGVEGQAEAFCIGHIRAEAAQRANVPFIRLRRRLDLDQGGGPSWAFDNEIDLSAVLRPQMLASEIAIEVVIPAKNLRNDEVLKRPSVSVCVGLEGDTQRPGQGPADPGVEEVEAWGLGLPFADRAVIRLDDAGQQCVFQNLKIGLDGLRIHAHISGDVGEVHDLAVALRCDLKKGAERIKPANEMSGDFFDWFARADGTFALVIADVCGKGMAAAMMMAVCRTLLRRAAMESDEPHIALARVNEDLLAQVPESNFITCALLYIDSRSGVVAYANAGHPSAILVRRDGSTSESIVTTGMVLGVKPGAAWTTERLTLAHGEDLVLISDGVTEAGAAHSRSADQFGSQRAQSAVSAACGGQHQNPRVIVAGGCGLFAIVNLSFGAHRD